MGFPAQLLKCFLMARHLATEESLKLTFLCSVGVFVCQLHQTLFMQYGMFRMCEIVFCHGTHKVRQISVYFGSGSWRPFSGGNSCKCFCCTWRAEQLRRLLSSNTQYASCGLERGRKEACLAHTPHPVLGCGEVVAGCISHTPPLPFLPETFPRSTLQSYSLEQKNEKQQNKLRLWN